MPKISVITPCYNSEDYINQAINSVLNQDYTNFEHIIVDGGSTDDTREIVDSYDHLQLITGTDNGIYDAINKGIRKASGDLIGWLNSDDIYAQNAFNLLVTKFMNNPESELVAGSCDIFVENNGYKISKERYNFSPSSEFNNGKISHDLTLLNGCLLSESLIENVGNFNSSLKIAGDTEYLVRIAATQPKICRITEVVYRYRQHSDSLTFNESNEINETGLLEGIEFMYEYADREDFPDSLRKYCLHSFRIRSLVLFRQYIVNGEILKGIKFAMGCIQKNKSWPVYFIYKFVEEYC